jgi:hypothetical protein
MIRLAESLNNRSFAHIDDLPTAGAAASRSGRNQRMIIMALVEFGRIF